MGRGTVGGVQEVGFWARGTRNGVQAPFSARGTRNVSRGTRKGVQTLILRI